MEYTVEPLEWARSVCHEAVSHVGAANYPERESEAHAWINQVFDQLPDIYKAAPDMYKALKFLSGTGIFKKLQNGMQESITAALSKAEGEEQ